MGDVGRLPHAPAPLANQGAFVMTNHTLVPGNPVPSDVALPLALSYNPGNRSVFVAGSLSDSVGEFVPTTGARLGGAYLGEVASSLTPFGPQLTAFAYDPTSGLAVAASADGQYLSAWFPQNFSYAGFFLPNASTTFDALAFDPATARLYAADALGGLVWVVNTRNWTTVAEVHVGSIPDALLLDASAQRLYVANEGSANLSVVNTTSETIVQNYSVGNGPVALALDPGRHDLWVLDSAAAQVVALNTSTGTMGSPVGLPSGSTQSAALVYDAGSSRLLVLNAPSGEITAIDVTQTSIDTSWRLGGVPYRAVLDPAVGDLVVGDAARNLLEAVNLTTGAVDHSTLLGSAPVASVVDPATGILWVADAAADQLVEVNAATGGYVGTVAVPASPIDLVLDPATDVIAVVEYANQVTFLNGSSTAVAATWGPGNDSIFLGGAYGNGVFAFPAAKGGGVEVPWQGTHDLFLVGASDYYELHDLYLPGVNTLVFDSRNLDFYATTWSTSLSVVSSASYAVSYLSLPFGGDLGLAYDNVTNSLYIGWTSFNFTSGTFDGNVSAYDLSTSLLGSPVTAGTWPQSIVYDWATRGVYISDYSNGSVYEVLDSAPAVVVARTVVGPAPIGLSVSSSTGLVYVPNYQAPTVSFLVASGSAVPLTVSLALYPSELVAGQTFAIYVTPSYPAWGDTVAYGGLPPGCVGTDSMSLTCAPTRPGSYRVYANVTDPAGDHASVNASVLVVGPLAISTLRLSPSSFDVGHTLQVLLTLQGGLAPLNVSYPVLPTGCTDTHGTNWNCTPSARGNFSVEAEVTDGLGEAVFANATGVANAPPQITSIVVAPATLRAGSPIDLQPVVVGGTAPFTFDYLGMPPGCAGATAANVTCTPSQPGNFSVEVQVVDADGTTATRTTTLEVAPAAPTSAASAGFPTLDLVVLVVAAAAVAVVAVALRRRRTVGSEPTEVDPDGGDAPTGAAGGGLPAGPTPRSTAIEGPGPVVGPTAPEVAPDEDVGVVEPATYEAGPEFELPTASAAPSGPARPPLLCPTCGTANEPWITVCRQCRRPLHTTG